MYVCTAKADSKIGVQCWQASVVSIIGVTDKDAWLVITTNWL